MYSMYSTNKGSWTFSKAEAQRRAALKVSACFAVSNEHKRECGSEPHDSVHRHE